jgi:hypothetical protein
MTVARFARCLPSFSPSTAIVSGQRARAALCLAELEAIIEIDDDGPASRPKLRKPCFSPFHRLEASRSAATGGRHWHGLAVARTIVWGHGGEITSPIAGNAARASVRAFRFRSPQASQSVQSPWARSPARRAVPGAVGPYGCEGGSAGLSAPTSTATKTEMIEEGPSVRTPSHQ